MLKKLFILSCLTAATLLPAGAKTSNVLDVKHSITDNAIVFPESYEQDTQKLLEGWYMKNYTATDTRYKTQSDPSTSDAVIMERLATLPTAIDMPFNQIVRSYIDRYTKRGRSGVAAILGLSNYYMPIFEQALEEAGLPLELKYLPVIESALNPNAVSRMGATGLWQFMLSAAKGYNLEVNTLVDERRDPYMSSRAAAAFLKDLYETYGDWSLVIAAYNCGPGNVNKALRRAGNVENKDFWTIYPYLPAETRGYVPMFIAANYVMNYYPEHNISPVLPTKPLVTDTVAVNSRVHFNQISKVLDIPVEELRILNPQFRSDVIPGTAKKPYMLILPSQQIHAYLMSEAEIKNYDAEKYARRIVAEPGVGATAMSTDETADNAVATGDDQNGLSSSDDLVAQEIMANPADEELAEEIAEVRQTARTKATKKSASAGKHVYTHVVKEGESIGDIAQYYGVTKSEIRMQNGLRREAVRTGQELRISTNAEVVAQTRTQSAPAKQKTQTQKTSSRSRDNSSVASNNTSDKQSKARTRTSSNSKKNDKQAQSQTKKGKKNKKHDEQAQSQTKKNKKNNKNNDRAEKKSKTRQHNIKEGESLSVIADKYGVSVSELKRANNLQGDNIRAGKSLNIPKKSKAKTSKKDNKQKESKSNKSSKSSKSKKSSKNKR